MRIIDSQARRDADRILTAILRDAEGKGSDAPGSPYGTKINQWAPVAAVACAIIAQETAESPFTESGPIDLDWCEGIISAVVNGSPSPGYVIANYGPLHGFDPADYLDNPADYDYYVREEH